MNPGPARAVGSKLRICLVSAALPDVPCGIGDYTHNLAAALLAENVEPVVVTTTRPGLRAAFPYETRPIATTWVLPDLARIAHHVLGTRPDLVHVQFPGFGYGRGFAVTSLPWALRLARPRLPEAITLHEFDRLSRRHRFRVGTGLVACRLVVSPSPGCLAAARAYARLHRGSQLALVPLASNLLPPPADVPGGRDAGRAAGELVVGYFGFLRPDKGLDTLVEAFAQVRERQPARLVIAGDPGPDADFVDHLRSLVAERGLLPDTLFTGALPAERLSATLRGFDVCVLPFRDGLAPNRGSYAAAVALGLPVITTSADRRGLDGPNRTFFVAPGDAAALRDAILARSAGTPGEPDGDVAAEWRAIARRHVELYRECLAK